MRTLPGLVVALVLTTTAARAQAGEMLQISPWFDGAIAVATVGTWVAVAETVQPPDRLERPVREPPGGIDRWAVYRVHGDWGDGSDYLLYGTMALSGAAVAWDGLRQRNLLAHAVIFGEVLLVNAMVTDVTKRLVDRPRPYTYTRPRGTLGDQNSFFSNHVSRAAASSFAAARILDLTHDLPGWASASLYTGAGALTFAVGAARIEGGMHFPTDVLAGALVGAAIGIGIPELHRPGGLVFGASRDGHGAAQLTVSGAF